MYKPTLGKSGASRSALPLSNGGSGFNSNITKSQANLSTVHSVQDPVHSSQQGSLQPNYSVSTLGKIRSTVQSDMSTKNRLNSNNSSSNIDPTGSQKKQSLELNVKQTAKVEVKQSTSPSNLRHLKLNSSHNIFKASALSPFSKNTPNQPQKSTNNKTPSASTHAPAGQTLIPSANRITTNHGINNNNNTRIATLDLTNEVKQTPITPFSTNIDQQQEAKNYGNPQNSTAVAAAKPASNYSNLNSDSTSESELAKSALSNLKFKMNTQRNPSQNPVNDEYLNPDQENQFDYSQNRRSKASVNDYYDNNMNHTPEEKSQTSNNFRDPFREGRSNNNHQNSRSPFQQRDQMNYNYDEQVKSSKPPSHTFNQPKHSNNNSNTFNQEDDRDNNNNYTSSQYQQQQRTRKPGSYSEPYQTRQIDEQQKQYQQHPANQRQNFDDHYSQQQPYPNQQYHQPLPNYPMYPRSGQQSHQPYPNYPPQDQNRYMNMPYPPQYYNDPLHGNYHNDSNPNMYHNDHPSYSNYPPNQLGPGPRGYPSQQSYEWKGRNDLGRVISYENFKRNSHNSYQQQQQRYPDEYPPSYYHQEQNYHRGVGSTTMGMDYANNPQGSYNNNNGNTNYGGFFDPRGPTPVQQQNPNYRVNGYYDKYQNPTDQQGSLHNRTYDDYPRNGQEKQAIQDPLNVKESLSNPFARNINNRQPTEPFPSERFSATISDQNRLPTSDISEMNYTQQKHQRQNDDRTQRDFPSQDYTRRDRSPAISSHVRGESNNTNANDATSRTTTRNNFYPARGNNNNLSETSTGNATTTNRDISRNRYDEQPDYYKNNESKTTRNTQRDSCTPDNSSIAPQSRQQQPKPNLFQQTPLEDDSTLNSKASKKSFDIISSNIASNLTKGQVPARNTVSDIPRDFKNVDSYDNYEEYSEQINKSDANSSYQRSLSNNQSKQQQQPGAYQKNSRSNYGGSNDHSIHEDKPTNVNNRGNTAMGQNSSGNRVPFDDMPPIKAAAKKSDPFAYEQTKGSENPRSNFESNRNLRNDQGKGMHSSVPSGASFDDIPIKGAKSTNLYSEAIDDYVQDDYIPQKQGAKSTKSPINSKANAQKKPQQNSTRDAYKRQPTDWEESEFEVNDEYQREDRPSQPRDFKAFQANYDSVDDDRPIKPSAAGGNYDLKQLPKSAIIASSNKPVQQQKGRMGNAGQGNRNIGQIGNDENAAVNIQLRECSQGCGRKFQLESLPKHEKICQSVFQKKRKVFDSQAKRTDTEELTQFNGGNQSSNKGGLGKKPTKQQSKPPQDDKSKQKKPEEAGAKPRWLKQSEAFRAVLKVSKGGDGATTSIPHSEAFSKEDYVQCHFCQRKFNETAAKRHIPFCEKKAKESSIKGPAPSKVIGSNNQPMQSSQQQQQQQRALPQKQQSQQQPVQQQAIVYPQIKSQKQVQSKAPASGYTAHNQPQSKRQY